MIFRHFYFLFNNVSCIHVLIKVKLGDPSSSPLHFICQSYKSQRKLVHLYCEKRKTPSIVMKWDISSRVSFRQQLFTTKTFSQNWIFMRNPHVLLIFGWHQTDSLGSFICFWWITQLTNKLPCPDLDFHLDFQCGFRYMQQFTLEKIQHSHASTVFIL